MKPELERNLEYSLLQFSATQPGFKIQLNNFSCFQPRVIFIDVVPNEQLTCLKDNLFHFLLSEGSYPIEKDERSFYPHVTIATRDLYKKSFHEAWDYFKDKKYEAEWMADGLSLLRHNQKNWELIASCQFK
jgi:2'-5' RNA ligase